GGRSARDGRPAPRGRRPGGGRTGGTAWPGAPPARRRWSWSDLPSVVLEPDGLDRGLSEHDQALTRDHDARQALVGFGDPEVRPTAHRIGPAAVGADRE